MPNCGGEKKKLSPENSLHSALHVQNLSAVMRSGEKFPTSESRHGEYNAALRQSPDKAPELRLQSVSSPAQHGVVGGRCLDMVTV